MPLGTLRTMNASPPALLLVTTETIAGHRIVRTLGYVAGFREQRLPTSDITLDAFEGIRAWAKEMGANAVVGVRWGEGAIYGTAVLIEPEPS